jgi:AraC family transcriptional regulator of adaptative response/methylated-DNA-[protein]-cysteine methyltransferase
MMTIEPSVGLWEGDIWHAVETRDRSYDGKFVFGTLSTNIYCKPSCPSRRPRRDRAVLFPGPKEAEAAGFRPCKRCKPADDDRVNPKGKLVQEACAYLENNRDRLVTLEELGGTLKVSPFHLQRTFKAILGITPRQYAEKLQLMNAKSQLRDGQSVRRSTYSSGHNSTGWLYSKGLTKLGMRPGEYKDGGSGMTIRFTTATCSLGWILVGGTERGVCSVSLGESKEEVRRYLANEFPNALLVDDKGTLASHLSRILDCVDGKTATDLSDLPLDILATSFQHRVWKELQKIPYGSTSTYSEIADKIGSPSAVRAVANVCAANPVAIVFPCHRVVRKDGGIGGYKWGIERKRALLAREAERAKDERPAR